MNRRAHIEGGRVYLKKQKAIKHTQMDKVQKKLDAAKKEADDLTKRAKDGLLRTLDTTPKKKVTVTLKKVTPTPAAIITSTVKGIKKAKQVVLKPQIQKHTPKRKKLLLAQTMIEAPLNMLKTNLVSLD